MSPPDISPARRPVPGHDIIVIGASAGGLDRRHTAEILERRAKEYDEAAEIVRQLFLSDESRTEASVAEEGEPRLGSMVGDGEGQE
jgi:hypothetical protein